MSAPDEKLHKVLARAGLGSRREIEEWIGAGRVRIDGRVARVGDRVSGSERILVDGHRVAASKLVGPATRVIAYHKPVGQVVSRSDPGGFETVFEHLPPLKSGRWIAVGRLDLNTSGLLLLTTDGELANVLMHPSRRVIREYAVRVQGEASREVLQRLTHGVRLEDGEGRFEEITVQGGAGTNQWYYCCIAEGRKREVRRLWESQGLRVSRLIRVRYGPIQLPARLRRGRWQDLSAEEIDALRVAAGLEPLGAAPAPKKRAAGAGRGGSKTGAAGRRKGKPSAAKTARSAPAGAGRKAGASRAARTRRKG